MPRILPAESIREEYDSATEAIRESDELRLVEATPHTDQQIQLQDYKPLEVVELGRALDEAVFYTSFHESGDGTPERGQIFFVHDDVVLVQARIRESEEEAEELERKRELADELLREYPDVMSDAQEYRLEHNVRDMRMDRLFKLQDRLEEKKAEKEREEKIDENREQRLAQALYQDDRFNRQYNETDTEMLLQTLDIEFDLESIRVPEVHQRAKSLLKVHK